MSHRIPLLLFTVSLCAATASAQLGGQPGSFSRMGFGARGMAMGNAMTAVISGDLVGYYNPASIPWTTTRTGTVSFGILSLDRQLNFLSYNQPLAPLAGISFGIINAGVSNIDGRDADGEPTGALKTSENQIFLGFATKLKGGFTAGLNLKFYYYHLYTDMTSTTAGLDFGLLYAMNNSFTVGLTIKDIMSKYKWDSSQLYGENGVALEDQFPTLYTLGVAYWLPDSIALIALDLEHSGVNTTVLRMGAEIPLVPEITVRAGVDRIDLKEKGMGVRPAFGFTARKDLQGWTPSVNYAFVLEPFSPSGMHMISLAVTF